MIYCINRKQDFERRDGMVAQLPDIQLVEAIECDAVGSMNAGETGCFKSHMGVWIEIVTIDIDLAIVLEDDVTILSDDLMYDVKRQLSFDVLMLQSRDYAHCDKHGNFTHGFGAWGYAITNDGAAKSLESVGKLQRQIDMQWYTNSFRDSQMFFTGCEKVGNVVCKVSDTALVKPAPIAVHSVIGDKKNLNYCGGKI